MIANMLQGKNILVGITGSIAAYKAAILVRNLIREGAEVKVIMTPLAKEFITPLTMATLAKNPILVDFFDPEDGRWNSHVSLGQWADAYLIAPATANTIAKMTTGVADNLLLTTYLSARCPVLLAPAMDLDMYAHITTQDNLQSLRLHGVTVVEPDSGELASGLIGKGRMAEPEEIVAALHQLFQKKKSLERYKFVITAGPTVEAIDPVRYITNHSTGTMGYSIAEELLSRGAEVVLVSGPTSIAKPKGATVIEVSSAKQMYQATVKAFEGKGGGSSKVADGAIMSAAVADYTPVTTADKKVKKSDGDLSIELKRTKDIAAELGKVKGKRLLVGFALETDNEVENAICKIERKNLDFIVLNSLREKGAGFGTTTNKVSIIDSKKNKVDYPIMDKSKVAAVIVDKIEQSLKL